MTETIQLPDAEFFYGLYDGLFKPQLVRTAILVGLFEPIATQPLDVEGLARAVKAQPSGIEKLADYLVAIGLLNRSEGFYSLTVSAKVFLVRSSKAYAGDLILGFTTPEFWDRVLASVKTGKPQSMLERFDQDAWVESYRTSRIDSSLEMWEAVGIMATERAIVNILDLASGCGIKTFCLAQRESRIRVTCVDNPEVLLSAKDLAERMGITNRVTLLPGDISTIRLSEQHYEACLAGQITHYLTAEQNRNLFARIHDALVPGGKFIIDVPIGQIQPEETPAFLSFVLWANSGGSAHSYEEYEEWLRASGFHSIRKAGIRWIIADR
jgi:SAM-dependent methyltransferase